MIIEGSEVCEACSTKVKEDKKINLSDYSINQMIEWRDAASKRVTDYDKSIDDLITQIKTLGQKSYKDRVWIAKLNRKINKIAFGYKNQLKP